MWWMNETMLMPTMGVGEIASYVPIVHRFIAKGEKTKDCRCDISVMMGRSKERRKPQTKRTWRTWGTN